MTPYPLRSNGKWLRVRYGAIMTPYQMICGSPFKMVVNLDFWHLWVFFLLVLKKFRGWQNPSKKVKVRLFSDFFLENKTLPAFPFCSNLSLSLFNFHESFSITGDTIRNGLDDSGFFVDERPSVPHKINEKDTSPKWSSPDKMGWIRALHSLFIALYLMKLHLDQYCLKYWDIVYLIRSHIEWYRICYGVIMNYPEFATES